MSIIRTSAFALIIAGAWSVAANAQANPPITSPHDTTIEAVRPGGAAGGPPALPPAGMTVQEFEQQRAMQERERTRDAPEFRVTPAPPATGAIPTVQDLEQRRAHEERQRTLDQPPNR